MRIALLSDIHGNAQALEAVLEDAGNMGADLFWVLGDLVAVGPDPVAVLDRLGQIELATVVRGNTDRYVVTGDRPFPTLADVEANPDLIDLFTSIRASYDWTRAAVASADRSAWLGQLPVEARLVLSDGSRLLGVHASPGSDDGDGLHPGLSHSEIADLLAGCEADIVCAGHTHEPIVREIGEVQAINVGSVSNPKGKDARACYALLESSPAGTSIHHRRVSYDHDAFMESVRRSGHPAACYIMSFQLGQHAVRAPHPEHVVGGSSPECENTH